MIYLGAANLVGYLAGALTGRPLTQRLSACRSLQLMNVCWRRCDLLAALAVFGFLSKALVEQVEDGAAEEDQRRSA
jgi:hypothetical protein